MQPVVVYDTNILVSGSISSGSPYHCLELARQGIVEGLTCQEILDELDRILSTKFNFSRYQTKDTIDDFRGFLRLVEISNTLKVIAADPEDDKIIECAVVGEATHIVTGDKRHLLPLGSYQDIPIVAAAAFLTRFPDVEA